VLFHVAEVIALEDHVVEFQEGHRLFALKPQLDRIEGQHPVDGEVRAHFLQQFDVTQLAQPVVVVDHDRIGRSVAKGQQAIEDCLDRGNVGVDRLVRKHLAALVAPGGIADPRRPPTHQHDRLVSGLLQPAQQHDLDQRADMERWRGGIEADIARHDLLRGEGIKPFRIGHLVDVAALFEQAEQGRVVSHGSLPGFRARA